MGLLVPCCALRVEHPDETQVGVGRSWTTLRLFDQPGSDHAIGGGAFPPVARREGVEPPTF